MKSKSKMTPKKKANELVDKYLLSGVIDDYVLLSGAKKCALIAVDEIINTVIGNDWSSPILPFWEEVKQEIENL
jgi:hypothetical protein